jgi:hypothetical protein
MFPIEQNVHLKYFMYNGDVIETVNLHFKADSKPQISQQYNEIGNIRESKSFSNSLQGLFKPIVFFILKYAFLAFSATSDSCSC